MNKRERSSMEKYLRKIEFSEKGGLWSLLPSLTKNCINLKGFFFSPGEGDLWTLVNKPPSSRKELYELLLSISVVIPTAHLKVIHQRSTFAERRKFIIQAVLTPEVLRPFRGQLTGKKFDF